MHTRGTHSPGYLDVRPVEDGVSRMFVKMGFGFVAMSLVMGAVGILAVLGLVGGFSALGGYGFVALGVAGVIGNVFLIRWAYRAGRTVVRFQPDGDELVVEWRTGSSVVRTERVSRRDVVEVAVTDAPSSGASSYGLVVGLRNGAIDLTAVVRSGTEVPPHYIHECQRLAAFLGVPARSP